MVNFTDGERPMARGEGTGPYKFLICSQTILLSCCSHLAFKLLFCRETSGERRLGIQEIDYGDENWDWGLSERRIRILKSDFMNRGRLYNLNV